MIFEDYLQSESDCERGNVTKEFKMVLETAPTFLPMTIGLKMIRWLKMNVMYRIHYRIAHQMIYVEPITESITENSVLRHFILIK